MATVPRYDTPQVEQNTLPAARFDAPEAQNFQAKQLQQAGDAVQRTGVVLSHIEAQAQNEANQLRVDDALNKAREVANRMTFDKDIGYTTLRGENALNRPGGKPMADEYAENLKKQIENISGSLGNDAQKIAFGKRSNDLVTTFHGNALQHETAQQKEYANTTDSASIQNKLSEIAQNFANPQAVQQAIDGKLDDNGEVVDKGIKQYIAGLAQRNGQGQEWQDMKTREVVSGAHKEIVMRLLDQSPSLAQAYLDKNIDALGDHVTTLQRTLRPAVDREQGNLRGEKIFKSSTPFGSDFGTIVSKVLDIEGGYVANDAGKGETNMGINKTANPDVDVKNLTRDQAVALYKERYWNGIGADSLPANIRAIAFDAAVNHGVSTANRLVAASGGDPERLIELRRAEYQKLLERNPEKFGKYEKSWMSRLDQLSANTKGDRALAPMLEQANAIEDNEQRQIAVHRVKTLFSEETAAKTEAYKANFNQAQEIAFAKEGGWRDVPAAVWGELKPEDRSKLMVKPKASDPDTLIYLSDHPEDWKVGKIEKYRSLLSESDYIRLRDKGNGPDGPQKILEASIDADQFKDGLTKAGMTNLLKAKTGSADQATLLDLRAKFEKVIDAEQQVKGRKLSLDEKNTLLTRLIKPVKVAQVRTGSLFGWFDGQSSDAEMRTFQVKNPGSIRIPETTRGSIVAEMEKRGIRPTPDRILNAYLSMEETK